MTLEELQAKVDKDLAINDIELDLESLKTPQIFNKYLKEHTKYSLMLSKARVDFAITKKDKWEYYTGKASPEVYKEKPFDLKILKPDVDKYLESDDEYVLKKTKVDYLETIVNYLDQVLRQIQNRTFQIKNAIEWKRFTSGAI